MAYRQEAARAKGIWVRDPERAHWQWAASLEAIGFFAESESDEENGPRPEQFAFRRSRTSGLRPKILVFAWTRPPRSTRHRSPQSQQICLNAPSTAAVRAFYDAARQRGGIASIRSRYNGSDFIAAVEDHEGVEIRVVYDPQVQLFRSNSAAPRYRHEADHESCETSSVSLAEDGEEEGRRLAHQSRREIAWGRGRESSNEAWGMELHRRPNDRAVERRVQHGGDTLNRILCAVAVPAAEAAIGWIERKIQEKLDNLDRDQQRRRRY